MGSSKINVRPLRLEDAHEIIQIAKMNDGFTPPSDYVIWMLQQTQGELCLVAEDINRHVIGYMLALQSSSSDTIFVWQLAADGSNAMTIVRRMKFICHEAVAIWKRRCIKKLEFTTSSFSRTKVLRILAEHTAGNIPVSIGKPMNFESGKEELFTLQLKK